MKHNQKPMHELSELCVDIYHFAYPKIKPKIAKSLQNRGTSMHSTLPLNLNPLPLILRPNCSLRTLKGLPRMKSIVD